MDSFLLGIGQEGVAALVAGIVFIVVFRYSRSIFEWVEDKTYQKREYILKQLELIYVQYDPVKLTYILLGMSFGTGFITLIFFFLSGQYILGIFLGFVVWFIGWKIPMPFVDHLVKKKNMEFQGQLVDALQLLANGLRAGQSLPQSLAMVVDELPSPVSNEFNFILQQNRIGLPLEECLEELYKRVPLSDNQMFVTSINILHETGGNLPEVFRTIVEIIRERIRVEQKIQTYIAQGMIQGITLFCMPFVIAFMFYLTDPSSVARLWNNPLGIICSVVAIMLDCVGAFFIYKIVNIKL